MGGRITIDLASSGVALTDSFAGFWKFAVRPDTKSPDVIGKNPT